jgi:8-oxo-dGTP pyrophosphatase MutT (NUDIX family)
MSPGATRVEAAVLVPLHRGPAGEPRLVLIERTAHGVHGGQIAFPGGRREPADRSPRDTAVREAVEELGVPPETVVPVLDLPPVPTRSTGFLVTPVVGHLLGIPAVWRPQPTEVASVLDVAAADLADPANAGEQTVQLPGRPDGVTVPVVRLGRHTVWGLTLRILQPLLPRVLAGEFPPPD